MKVLSVSFIPGPSRVERREIMASLAATFTLTFMAVATPEDEKSASIVGAGFKPALRREIGSIRHGTALGGFETRYKPCFVVTSVMLFTLRNH